MAFVKLDTGILDSTLWMDRDQKDVFLAALCMAQPWETLESLRALRVRDLTETGFVVPPGWYGFVAAAGVGIARRAMIEREAGLIALEKLGEPDSESRNERFDGRRLVRVDGGYIVLNLIEYRDRDNTASERMKRFRQRKAVTRNAAPVTRISLPAEDRGQRTEEEKEIDQLSLVSARPSAEQPAPGVPGCPHKAILALWAEVLPAMPQHLPQQWRGTRERHLRARWRETAAEKKWPDAAAGLLYLRNLFAYCGRSKFLTGRAPPKPDRPPFEIELAWLVNPTNWAKVLEGKYHPEANDDRGRAAPPPMTFKERDSANAAALAAKWTGGRIGARPHQGVIVEMDDPHAAVAGRDPFLPLQERETP